MADAPSLFDPLWMRVAMPLRRAIVSGELPPGEPLSENKLAAEYGVSRTPVREALRLLMEEGLVEMLPGRKVRVAVPRAADVREVYDMRWVLEAEAMRRLADAGVDAAPLLRAMEHACDDADAALALRDLAALAAANERFHAALIGGLGNARLTAQYRTIYNLIALYRNESLRTQSWAEAGTIEHRALLARLREGDTAGALMLLRNHIENARDIVCARFKTAIGERAA